MKLYKADAIVLRARDCGEGDKILTLYSREHGRIKAMAHGVSKPTSRKRGAVQPFTRSRFLLRRGRELDTVSQCEGVETFPFLRESLERIGYASYVAELVEALTPEGEPNESLFFLLLDVLRLLAGGDAEMLARAFELKVAALLGYCPVLERCSHCQGALAGPLFFSSSLGGAVCGLCVAFAANPVEVNKGTLEILKALLNWPLARIGLLRVNRRFRNRIRLILRQYLTYHLERDLKSYAFLDRFGQAPAGSGAADV
ncbi:MAG: DNA repair protein RecO [Pelotomaculum sp.]|uniref:DNA repair protein RecO n=1 Tax=Pelotomaculum thermopropionicum (strain DSM 13744 / JCM 10971 / SI) TaxID=370438 RepID=RECO_PELTS|nr:RecName: Full=DNA repair protein RecO; AltName: Full=Recombination protein O [Pelotomaculum thermopropionicum SI]NPV72831.1 DNA repair protein RecO [Pelotomaculum sp.]BAF59078.1 recombinational DNA repair protein [Pelotomaculum thermopropionicum SI]